MNDYSARKVAWVTGASSGIGEALAYALAERGASLILSARREGELRRVQAACARPDEHLALPLDMRAPDTFGPAVRSVLNKFGRIDMLVHCAGISQRARAVEASLEVDRSIMELNYFGPIALTKQVLSSMLARRAGHIVIVSSLLGKFGGAQRSAYCASKHALHGFFDALRAEVHADGIAVTMVCPGFVRTNASFNALTGDGTPHGVMDRDIARGLASSECARQIVRAIEHRRREVYIGKQKLAVYFNRFAPGVFSRIMQRRAFK